MKKNNRIAIDARLIKEGPPGGIRNFIIDYLSYIINKHLDIDWYLIGIESTDQFISKLENKNIICIKIKKIKWFPNKLNRFYEIFISMPNAIQKINADLFFSPYFDLYLPKTKKSIISILDMCYWDVPNYYSWLTKKIHYFLADHNVKSATAILTISHTSKDRILKQWKLNKQVYVLNNSLLVNTKNGIIKSDRFANLPIGKKVVLYTGGDDPRKRLGLLLKVADLVYKKNKNFCLAITGQRTAEFCSEYIQYNKLNAEAFYLTENLSSTEMQELYHAHATGVVTFSEYEGFGRSILEAMMAGLPVLCSDIPIFREVGRSWPTYCDPESEIIVDVFEKFLLEPKRESFLPKEYEFLNCAKEFEKIISSNLE
jgi:glycosyltransferase involved in cell wall biosynthesis